MSKRQKSYLVFKRCFDLIFALVLLVILSPIMLIAMIWIKLESNGSVIFKQNRPGRNQKIFPMYKFRSMRIETEKNGKALSDKERLTVSGKILRKTSIDELPQLINIIKGEMSFIGPRPFLINDLGSYNEKQCIRFEVLPGITSWTAIHGRNVLTIQEKYNYEIYYVKHIGLKIDAEIFFKTIFLVLSCKEVEDTVNAPRIAAEIIENTEKIGKKNDD